MTPEALVSQIWPEWKTEKVIGRGSYGTVYRAVRTDIDALTYSAIKVIGIPSDSTEVESLRYEGLTEEETKKYFREVLDEFTKEIRTMEELKDVVNVVKVEDYKILERTDAIGWDIIIRMELLTPLNAFLCDKNLSEDEVIKLGCDICCALEACHERDIMHRDVKPENIFVSDFGDYKLGDFGIARRLENLSYGMSQKGTYNYIAPEVVNGSEYDSTVDIYSLGLVLYKLMNKNRLPFLNTEKQLLSPSERKNAVDRRLRGEKLIAPCNASADFSEIILAACSFDPSERFACATDMKEALQSLLAKKENTFESNMSNELNTASNEIQLCDSNEGPIENGPTSSSAPETKKKQGRIVIMGFLFGAVAACILILLLIGSILLISIFGSRFVAPQKEPDTVVSGEEDSTIESDTLVSDEIEDTLNETVEPPEPFVTTDEKYESLRQSSLEGNYEELGPLIIEILRDKKWLKDNYREEISTEEECYIYKTPYTASQVKRFWKDRSAEFVIIYRYSPDEPTGYMYRVTDNQGNYITWIEFDAEGNFIE